MRTLKRILVTRYTALVAALLVLVSFLAIIPIRSYILSRQGRDLQEQAKVLAGLSPRFFTGEMSPEEVDDYLEELDGKLPLRITLIDTEGRVLGDSEYPAEEMENHAGRPEVAAALRGEVTSVHRESRTLNKEFIYAAAPVVSEGKIVGVARVSIEEEDVVPVIRRIWWIFLGAFGLLLLVIIGTSAWTERTVTGELNDLRKAANELAAGDLSRRVREPKIADFSELARDFNAMAEEIRLRVEEAREERSKLEAIIANVSTGVLVTDIEKKIVLVNRAAERILGVDVSRMTGRRLIEVFSDTQLESAVGRALVGESVEMELGLVYPRSMTLRLRANPVKSQEGSIAAAVCTLEDVTTLKRLDRIRQDFVANVSHELRTPVATVRALAQSLLEGAMEDRNTAQRFLHDLDRETARLAQLVEDLLTLSRLEAEETVLRLERFPLREPVTECLESKAKLASKYGVEISAEGDEKLVVEADRRLLGTLIGNLLDNAVKYNRPGGRVWVRYRAEREGTVIEVEDTGIGIPRRELARIFERFYRVDKARSRETGGTGLGLSIVKHIAERHGGWVTVESEEGVGTVFSVYLPPAEADRI